MPIHYDPLWPFTAFILAVLAVPIGLLMRRLGGATGHSLMPVDWDARRLMVFALGLTAAFVVVIFSAVPLEAASQRLLEGSPGEASRSLAQLWAQLGWASWQGVLMLLPVGGALVFIAELSWPRAPVLVLAHFSVWPLYGAGISALLRDGPPPVYTAALAAVPLLAFGVDRGLRRLPSRWHAWRARAPELRTRASSLPAAMAASFGPPPVSAPTRVITPLPRTEVVLAPTIMTRPPTP